jgi:hypothetical protein
MKKPPLTGDLYPDWEPPPTMRVKKRGHAAQPGTGPEGEKCKTCRHIQRKRYAKVYIKCGHKYGGQSNGPATDIRANDPACELWEKG